MIYLHAAPTIYRANPTAYRQNGGVYPVFVFINCLSGILAISCLKLDTIMKICLAVTPSIPYKTCLKIVLFILLCQCFTVKGQSAAKTDTFLSNKPFVAWAKQHAFALQDADKAIGYNDLQPLKNIIGNARIVGLGEPSHGMHEPQAFRNRLFKYLVEQCGFTTIVFEAGLAETEEATRFVANGSGSPQSGAKKMTIGNASPENIELMQWMRQYNANPLHKNKVKFYGMDLQLIGYPGDTTSRHAAIDIVITYLRKVDPQSAIKITSTLSPYLSRLSVAKYPSLSPQEHDQLSAILDNMIALIERQQIHFIANSSKDEYNWAHRVAIVARQTDRLARVTPPNLTGDFPPETWVAVNTRDAAMADNVMWILNNRANGKVMVYSHNAHVTNAPLAGSIWDTFAKAPNPLGQYLRSALGKDYFIIGTSFAPLAATAKPGSVDMALLQVGKPRFIVNLQAASVNPQIKAWLTVKRPMEANVHFYFNMPIGTAFDALLFMDKSAPTK
jgi:erythromycin esterase